jgi:hypothetical protein
MATDITFEQLNTALGANAITFAAGKLTIDTALVTGDTYSAVTNAGVLELMYKLRAACGVAQNTINATETDGSKLDAFPSFSYSPPVDGYVTVTQIQKSKLPINTSVVIGNQI